MIAQEDEGLKEKSRHFAQLPMYFALLLPKGSGKIAQNTKKRKFDNPRRERDLLCNMINLGSYSLTN